MYSITINTAQGDDDEQYNDEAFDNQMEDDEEEDEIETAHPVGHQQNYNNEMTPSNGGDGFDRIHVSRIKSLT